jgi:hypothetical protein
LNENQLVPKEYEDKCKIIAEKQIVIAGHRLANLLKTFKFSFFD